MNKAELIDSIMQEVDVTKKVAAGMLDSFIRTISEVLAKDEKVILTGFGTFQISHSAARTGRNPQTGATMQISAKKRPVFKAGKVLKDAVQ
jgi:DNA-binding protein HU-beta